MLELDNIQICLGCRKRINLLSQDPENSGYRCLDCTFYFCLPCARYHFNKGGRPSFAEQINLTHQRLNYDGLPLPVSAPIPIPGPTVPVEIPPPPAPFVPDDGQFSGGGATSSWSNDTSSFSSPDSGSSVGADIGSDIGGIAGGE